jgi:hypothetical protein
MYYFDYMMSSNLSCIPTFKKGFLGGKRKIASNAVHCS